MNAPERIGVTVAELPALWRSRAEQCREIGDERGALMYARLADELEATLARQDELLTLTAAAARSGYGADSLRRMIRRGALRDYGRRHAPRVLASELPRKPGVTPAALTLGPGGRTSRAQIARAVVPLS